MTCSEWNQPGMHSPDGSCWHTGSYFLGTVWKCRSTFPFFGIAMVEQQRETRFENEKEVLLPVICCCLRARSSTHSYFKGKKRGLKKQPRSFLKPRSWIFSNTVNHQISTKSSISLAHDKTQGRKTHKQATNCSKGLSKHDRRLKPVIARKGFSTKYWQITFDLGLWLFV